MLLSFNVVLIDDNCILLSITMYYYNVLLITSLFHGAFTKKHVISGHSKRTQKVVFQDQLSLNAGQKYYILQYFPPSLSYHLSLRPLVCLFLVAV